ncbi:MAG: cobyrinate a,c-diamide synthase [Propionibacteriaceae bacterium]|nr:cobyrinate a,c-diamide synthase [Propionibacteriaceae bacterium]
MRLPRIVVAAAASGQGKTTITTGIIAALAARGLTVQGFKVGPDFIDPGYHAMASGRLGRNLDPFLVGEQRIAPLLAHGAEGADISVIEGVMGLYDGQLGRHGFGSTAHVAALTTSPVVLCLDASATSRSIAAVGLGLTHYDRGLDFAGIIINKVATPRHRDEVLAALDGLGLPILGILPRDAAIEAPSRHLGLVPVEERSDARATMQRLAEQVETHIDLDALIAAAGSAPEVTAPPWRPENEVRPPSPARPVVAVAGGRAFTFRYAETLELLQAAGCQPVIFDPAADHALPEGIAGIYLGGGFPEVHAAAISSRESLLADLRQHIAAGVPVVAECAGMLYLARSVDGAPMVGAIPGVAAMGPRLTLGYRSATALQDGFYTRTGEEITGHEFHRTSTQFPPGATSGWRWQGPHGSWSDGWSSENVHASYLHVHWAGQPQLAQRFAEAVHAFDGAVPLATPGAVQHREVEPDLHHHGDAELADGVVDLAVNVRLPEPPGWLLEEIQAAPLAAYPDARPARAALATWHGVEEGNVLPVAGVAEAFTLIARGLSHRHPVVVHPQFTEPEAALRAAGVVPGRVLTWPEDGFAFQAERVPGGADLVMIGNPTNPTGVLHPAEEIRRCCRPGRVVVVDEAFMDAVPGESESMLVGGLTGLLVLRSLTKTWGLAGLRVGYVVGDAELIAQLEAVQTPWAVSTPALAAMTAVCSDRAHREVTLWQEQLQSDREALTEGLRGLGLHVVASEAPFLLVRGPVGLREKVRARGLGLRRGDTFPGLGDAWFRVRIPGPELRARLLHVLKEELA